MAVMDMVVAMIKTIMVMISMIVRMVMTITTNLKIGTSFASNPGADNEDDDDMMRRMVVIFILMRMVKVITTNLTICASLASNPGAVTDRGTLRPVLVII